MRFIKKLFGRNRKNESNLNDKNDGTYSANEYVRKDDRIQGLPKIFPNKEGDDFIERSLEHKFQELEDNRWFSDFKDLPEIDRLKKNGDFEEALELTLACLKQFPDSFLFYGRAADIYDLLDKPEDAIQILKIGLEKSLSKCSIAKNIAERAFKRNDYREAIFWWIQSALMQLESGIMVDYLPFLNLAYLSKFASFYEVEKWFFSKADEISKQGPIRFDTTGANLRLSLLNKLILAKDNAPMNVLEDFYIRYKDH